MAFLCVSQQGEFKNTIKNFFGEIHVKNFWPKKVEKKNLPTPFGGHLPDIRGKNDSADTMPLEYSSAQ